MGRATLGRIMNVIGEPIDEKGDISKKPKTFPSMLFIKWLLPTPVSCYIGILFSPLIQDETIC